jgi:hypothetical protein
LGARECPWGLRTCAEAAGHGRLAVLLGHPRGRPGGHLEVKRAVGAHGALALGRQQLRAGTWRCCSGRKRTAVPTGTRAHARLPPAMGICRYFSHLTVLQWARVNGCPRIESTCELAAASGHLEVLRWARANGCRWNKTTCRAAAATGFTAVLQWARANGCPG